MFQRVIYTEEIEYHEENKLILFDSIAGYKAHLESIYELPMFYGDATMENLIQHTKNIVELVGEFEEIMEDNYEELTEDGGEAEFEKAPQEE